MLKVPQPPGINVELCELELPTKITRFLKAYDSKFGLQA
jgi:hypothetical protein